ncbi:MAG: outer membrane lipoprotein carrier protein LolA [Pseudomonadota bacterium]
MLSTLSALATMILFTSPPQMYLLQDEPLDAAEIEAVAPVAVVPEQGPDAPRVEIAAPDDVAPAAPAPVTEPGALSDADRAEILEQAAASLANTQTARGRFTQVAPDFTMTTGDFALRRPGRMRFEYDDPTPLLIISDGATVAIEDRDLETVDRVPLASTPLGLVLDDTLDFDAEADVTDIRRADGFVAVSMRDRSGEAEGELTLILDEANYELVAWRTVDDAGGVTSVQLSDVETGTRLDPRLFRIEDPEDEDDRRR